jgi:hypothetical protein
VVLEQQVLGATPPPLPVGLERMILGEAEVQAYQVAALACLVSSLEVVVVEVMPIALLIAWAESVLPDLWSFRGPLVPLSH